MKSQRALPFWVEAWLALSAVICTLDVVYTMLRPITLRGGRLGVAYAAWNLYSDIDLRYADEKDLVTMATGRIMVIEIIMNLVALLMAFLGSRHTLLTAFTASAFVFWKTLLYMALYVMIPEGAPNYLSESSYSWRTILIFWIPDGIWIVFPFAVMVCLWPRITNLAYYSECSTRDMI